MRLLLVEDEPILRAQLHESLSELGYAVDSTASGKEARFLGTETEYDAAIVDLGLPDMDGMSVIRDWRAGGRNFPVMILTARGRWQEKVEGLESGADDYLVKPFHFGELRARLQALIRRAAGHGSKLLTAGGLVMDVTSRTLHLYGQAIELTAYEFNLLEVFLYRQGQTLSKRLLTEHLYDQDFDRDSNLIEVFVRRLRQKLDPDGKLQPIATLRGQGYRFDGFPDQQ